MMPTNHMHHALAEHLNNLSFNETRHWLSEALHGRKWLPLLTPSEVLYLGILRLERNLSKATRRDLADACLQLVEAFVSSGQGDEEYLNSLLQLAVRFELKSLAAPLASMVKDFPQRADLSTASKKIILSALVDLKVPQPKEFWRGILTQNPIAHAGIALSGLLAIDPSSAIEALHALPEDQSLADVVSVVLEHTASQLPTRQKADFIAQIQMQLPRCQQLLRESIQDWFAEAGVLSASSSSKADVIASKTRASNLSSLAVGLKKIIPTWDFHPAVARLTAQPC